MRPNQNIHDHFFADRGASLNQFIYDGVRLIEDVKVSFRSGLIIEGNSLMPFIKTLRISGIITEVTIYKFL